MLRFTAEEVKRDVFDPVVNRILNLCRQLQSKTQDLKAIFMVGGFSDSPYLHTRMVEEFEPKGIRIVQPNRPGMKNIYTIV